MSRRILVVEDDWLPCQSLKYWLEHEGYAATFARDGQTAMASARAEKPDLVLVDVGLPDCDGFDLAQWLRSELSVPFMFVTARAQEADIVRGLELGAEDYVIKPFKMRELLARIRVVLRRAERGGEAGSRGQVLVIHDVLLDPRNHEVCVHGEPVELPPKEFELLHLLMANAGTVLTSEYLLEAVWGADFSGALQVLYVHIGWLRDRIEDDPRHPQLIQTVRGVGYKFAGPRSAPAPAS
jgi:DNA-binding response OmpR family regulator